MSAKRDGIQQFLLIYDRKRDRLVSSESFGEDVEAATIGYRAAEQLYHDRPEMDIVLVGSDSLETVKRTHSTYFQTFTADDLRSLVASLDLL
ncbi:MAG: hypothetical protein SPH79_03735 [Schaalia hyovaginalis]|uniref:hypothetical protein n=1 Tax=Schaalia hyovaginalis TaxID=29316 RepID=UPI002A8415B7|nr:hypothetical protein [Schaalia hyovaginalis]MDY3665829.1 hypothetical protein [Schaalia hyovaginalis]MDY6213583.1 hypothetical protein [Schaalia hyovaginalis]